MNLVSYIQKSKVSWKAFVEVISPARAKEYLERRNKKNRKTNKARVDSYAREMVRGFWKPSPFSAIGFDESGMLLNGHHRLEAVIATGVTCEFVVFYDVPYDVLRFTDCERPRTPSQIGQMFDEPVKFDTTLKALAFCRNGKAVYVSAADVEELRREFAGVIARFGGDLLAIRVAGRALRAGALAGFLFALQGPVRGDGVPVAVAEEFLRDFIATSRKEILGHKATRNLIQWLENNSGVDRRLAEQSASAVVTALRQFARNVELDCIRAHGTNSLEPYLPSTK